MKWKTEKVKLFIVLSLQFPSVLWCTNGCQVGNSDWRKRCQGQKDTGEESKNSPVNRHPAPNPSHSGVRDTLWGAQLQSSMTWIVHSTVSGSLPDFKKCSLIQFCSPCHRNCSKEAGSMPACLPGQRKNRYKRCKTLCLFMCCDTEGIQNPDIPTLSRLPTCLKAFPLTSFWQCNTKQKTVHVLMELRVLGSQL